jgi:hypothetical protein
MKNRKQFAHRVDMWDDGGQVARQCRRVGSPGGMRLLRPNARRAPRTLARSERLTGLGTRHRVSLTTDKVVNRTNVGSLASRRAATVIRQRKELS